MYEAVFNIDFTDQNPNAYQKLISALIQAGWRYSETSALSIKTDQIERIWVAMELAAKQASSAGTLSALTVQVQLVGPEKEYKAGKNHPNAMDEILKLPNPRIP